MNTQGFAQLAEMRRLMHDMHSWPDLTEFKHVMQGMLGVLPDVSDKIQQELLVIAQCQQDFGLMHARMNAVGSDIDTQFETLLTFMSTQDHFSKNLEISKLVRDSWRVNQSTLDHMLLQIDCMHNVWKYPAACVNVQHDQVINAMLAFDYLYLIDCDPGLLTMQQQKQNNTVLHRLKAHVTTDFNQLDFGKKEFDHLRFGMPQGQMAMVMIPNLFERHTAQSIKSQLTSIKTLLRPGGLVVANAFNAHSRSVAQMMQNGLCAGLTRAQAQDLAQDLQMHLKEYTVTCSNDDVVLIFQLPGQLHSSKIATSRAFRIKS